MAGPHAHIDISSPPGPRQAFARFDALQPVPLVEVEHLHFTYPDGFEALKGLDVRIDRGEKVALVGPNGAGKSTFMLHLNGINLPSHGTVRIDGTPVDRSTVKRVRAQVGLVFQDPDDQLFSPTVFDDVAFGPLHMGVPEGEIHERVERALAAVGMGGFGRRLPHHLSLGQRKRVALATVLSMDPLFLVFDEPSAGLDPRGRRELIRLLRSLPRPAREHARHAARCRGLPADDRHGRRRDRGRRADRAGPVGRRAPGGARPRAAVGGGGGGGRRSVADAEER